MANGTAFLDDSGKAWTSFGGASVSNGRLVTAGGNYITTPNQTDWNFGADEFCVEVIATFQAFAERPVLGKWHNTDGISYLMGFGPSPHAVSFAHALSDGGVNFPVAATIAPNVQHHIAWYRRADGFFVAIDGVVYPVGGPGSLQASNAAITVGAVAYDAGGVGMYLYQMRVRRGSATAYGTSNFTPPSAI